MKRINFILVAATLLLAACSNNENTTTSDNRNADISADSVVDQSHNTDTSMGMAGAGKIDMTAADAPMVFASDAAAGSMMEITLAEYAKKNASSEAVKNYANMLHTDHSKANEKLKQIAAGKKMTLPTTMGAEKQQMANKLMGMKGADFDREYMTMMVDDHNKELMKFQDAAHMLNDAELKAFAAENVMVLREHLTKAKEIKSSLK